MILQSVDIHHALRFRNKTRADVVARTELQRQERERQFVDSLAQVRKREALGIIGGTAAAFAGAGVSAPPVTTPLTIVSSVAVTMWHRSDLGIITNDTPGFVNQWQDQTGNGNHFTQATTTMRPAYQATGGPGGKPQLVGDGVDDWMINAWNPTAPGTTPIWIWAVIRPLTQVASNVWSGNTASTLNFSLLSTASSCRVSNGVVGSTNSNLTLSAVSNVQALYSNQATDYLQVRSTTKTTGNVGNNDSTTFQIFSRNSGSGVSNVAFLEFLLCAGEPNVTELTNLTIYGSNFWGAGVFT